MPPGWHYFPEVVPTNNGRTSQVACDGRELTLSRKGVSPACRRRRSPASIRQEDPPMRKPIALLAAALVLAGCGGQDTATPQAPAASESFTAGGLTLDKRPEKIVSLSPTATETLYAIGAGSQVTAVDDQSNFPADAPKTDLSGFKPNAEAIAAKQPDLVIIANDIDKIKDQLTTLKIPVYLAAAAKTLPEAYQQFTDLGALTGHRK